MNIPTVKELCEKYHFTQAGLYRRFGIPRRTMQDWHAGRRKPPEYVIRMMQELLEQEQNEQNK